MKINFFLSLMAAIGFQSGHSVMAHDGHHSTSGRQQGSLVFVSFDQGEVSESEPSASDYVDGQVDELRLEEDEVLLEDLSGDEGGGSGIHDPEPLPPVAPPHPNDPVESILQNSPRWVPNGTDFAPIHWSGFGRAPNPIADYMRQQWCVDGLWDSHPAERAAQCAKQAYRISGAWRHHCLNHNCGGCNSGCCNAGCGNTACAECCGCSCRGNGCCKAPVNRYLPHRQNEMPLGCDARAPSH